MLPVNQQLRECNMDIDGETWEMRLDSQEQSSGTVRCHSGTWIM